MNIVKYERFDRDGIELIIDTATGESFASVKGYARMSGLSHQAISKRLMGNSEAVKTAEIVTKQGLRMVNLITESTIAQWLPKDNPTLASQLMLLGVRVFMHKLAGFEVSSAITGTQNNSTSSKALLISREINEIRKNLEGLPEKYVERLIENCIAENLGDPIKSFVDDEINYMGASSIARKMNFVVNKTNRVPLGKFMKKALPHLVKYQKRQCNNSTVDVAVYPDTKEVRDQISLYFASKAK